MTVSHGTAGGRHQRRVFLRRLAGAAGLTAFGGLGWRAWQQDVLGWRGDEGDSAAPGPDAGPDVGPDVGPLGGLITAAIFAANPHNSQPWRFHPGTGAVTLYRDPGRNLGALDPWRREMHIGLGCALENLLLAARAAGYPAAAHLLPDAGEPDCMARVTLDRAASGAPTAAGAAAGTTVGTAAELAEGTLSDGDVRTLAAAIPRRHTNRGPYHRDRRLSDADRRGLLDVVAPSSVVLLDADSPAGRMFARETVAATTAMIGDGGLMAASDGWYRHDRADIIRLRDGVTVANAGLSPMIEAIARMLPRPSDALSHRTWLASTRDIHCATAPLFGLITAPRDDVASMLRAGRVWQRLHLRATAQGIAMQPLNQMIEWDTRQRALGRASSLTPILAELVGDDSRMPVFAFRAGWPRRPAEASLRRPLRAVLI